MTTTPGAGAVVFGLPGPTLDDDTRALLRAGIAGVVLFGRSVQSPEQVRDLLAELREEAGRPIWLCVDQEGGVVARLRSPLTVWPPARALGDLGDPQTAEAVGRAMGAELRAVGFNCDFAPVLDVNTNPTNPVIGKRALGTTADAVCRVAGPYWRGLLASGVLPCGKHFPGHGDTDLDSHFHLPQTDLAQAVMEAEHLPPFAQAIEEGIPCLMTSHVRYPAWDEVLPATLSPAISSELLRHRLGFSGVLFSDDVEMKALADHWTIPQLVDRGLTAGIDLFLVCHRVDRAWAAVEAAEAWRIQNAEHEASFSASRARCDGALAQVEPGLSAAVGKDLAARIGTAAHRALAERLAGVVTDADAGPFSRGVAET